MDDDEIDSELVVALAESGRAHADERSEFFNEVILYEAASRGHLVCQLCGATLRDHILRVLRKGSAIEHRFQAEHQL
jgi:hypothetical protein